MGRSAGRQNSGRRLRNEGAATPLLPHQQAAACTHATLRPRHEHRRTICRTSRNVRSPDNRTVRRRATLSGHKRSRPSLSTSFSPIRTSRAAILRDPFDYGVEAEAVLSARLRWLHTIICRRIRPCGAPESKSYLAQSPLFRGRAAGRWSDQSGSVVQRRCGLTWLLRRQRRSW